MASSASVVDFKALPKLELHAHLSGSISRECLHDIWVRKHEKGETTLADPLIEMPVGKFDYDLESFFPLFSSYIYNLCNDLESLIYTTNAVLHDFQADGVVYLELRTTPRAMPSADLTKDDYVQTILNCISDFNSAPTSTMTAGLLLSIDRRNDPATALSVVDLALKYCSQGVVGIDLCGDPSVGDVSIFEPAFVKAKEHGLNITIHFAEAPHSSTDVELRKLLSYSPQRIGHVINVSDEVKEEIVKRKLGLELCLSCNVHAKMITGSYGDHHFGWWRDTGCPITLCTDDVGVFGSKLSNEYALIAEHFDLGRQQICELARSGIDTIFAEETVKAKLRDSMWI
ncbi:adenosine deaminase [Phlyctema vagabunda]|uniref:Adenosine deaminase n=1 Tax=Phlyctema vagabunda TaxID=108571 RepID=A0ABR4PKI8_9HELO